MVRILRRRPPRIGFLLDSTLLLLLALLASTVCAQSPSSELADPSTTNFNLTGTSTGFIYHLPATNTDAPLYITLSLCNPPSGLSSTLPASLPYALYVSNSSSNQQPGPSTSTSDDIDDGYVALLEQGFANVSLSSANEGAWIGVWTPDDESVGSTSSTGIWNYELAVSSEGPIEVLDGGASFKFDDADASSALLTTSNWTVRGDDVGTAVPRYSAVLRPTTQLTSGLARSRCFVQGATAGAVAASDIASSQTTRGYGGGRRMQYEASGLEKSQNYTSWLVQEGSASTRLWSPVFFRTKESPNCRLVHSLSFCPAVAYSVPAPSALSMDDLVSYYNASLASSIANFTRSLSTFPCNSTAMGGYSFISTCDDCLEAYRTWTCAITMPRCTDAPSDAKLNTSTSLEWSIPEAYQQTLLRAEPLVSRTPAFAPSLLADTFPSLSFNSTVTTADQSPFPYDEVPPCLDSCQLVGARCPPMFSWPCPQPGGTGTAGYGVTQEVDPDSRMAGDVGGNGGLRAGDRFGNVFCNSLGTDLQMAVQMSSAGKPSLGAGALLLGLVSLSSLLII